MLIAEVPNYPHVLLKLVILPNTQLEYCQIEYKVFQEILKVEYFSKYSTWQCCSWVLFGKKGH